MKKKIAAFAVVLLASQPAFAGLTGGGGFHVGAGLSQNSVSGFDTGTGFQIFGGYNLGSPMPKMNIDIEAGYMDTGDMTRTDCVPFVCFTENARAQGLWATGVVRYAFHPQWEAIGRAGADFGDDNGFMIGAGIGFNINPQMQLRAEYVERQNVNSGQINLIYKLY